MSLALGILTFHYAFNEGAILQKLLRGLRVRQGHFALVRGDYCLGSCS